MPSNGKVKKVKKSKSFLKQSKNSPRDTQGTNLSDYLLKKRRESKENLLEAVNIPSIPEEGVELHLDNSFNSIRKQLDDMRQQNLAILKQFASLDENIGYIRYIQESQYYYQYTNSTDHEYIKSSPTQITNQTKQTKTPSVINSSCSSLLSSNSSAESFAELFEENINSPLEVNHSPYLGAKLRNYSANEKTVNSPHPELFGNIPMPMKYNTMSRVPHKHKHQHSNSSEDEQPYSRPVSAASGMIYDATKRRMPPQFRRSSSIRCGFSSDFVSKIAHNESDGKNVTCL